MNKLIPKKIVEAFKEEDLKAISTLIIENPEQISFHTPFGKQTWLGYAASRGSLEVVQLLIKLGFDINAGDNRNNRKPITSACSEGHLKVVSYFIEHGAELDTNNSSCNPLFGAIVGRSPLIVKLLIDAGIDASVRYNSSTMDNMDAMAFALMQGEKGCADVIANHLSSGDEEVKQKLLKEADEISKFNAYKDRS